MSFLLETPELDRNFPDRMLLFNELDRKTAEIDGFVLDGWTVKIL